VGGANGVGYAATFGGGSGWGCATTVGGGSGCGCAAIVGGGSGTGVAAIGGGGGFGSTFAARAAPGSQKPDVVVQVWPARSVQVVLPPTVLHVPPLTAPVGPGFGGGGVGDFGFQGSAIVTGGSGVCGGGVGVGCGAVGVPLWVVPLCGGCSVGGLKVMGGSTGGGTGRGEGAGVGDGPGWLCGGWGCGFGRFATGPGGDSGCGSEATPTSGGGGGPGSGCGAGTEATPISEGGGEAGV
jgi:hypothetical protein